jgi:hypothetical protein
MDVLACATMNDAATCDKRWRAAGPRETSVSGTHHAPAGSGSLDLVGLPVRASSTTKNLHIRNGSPAFFMSVMVGVGFRCRGFRPPPPSPLPLPLPLRGWGWGWGWGWGDHLEPLGVGVKPSDGMGSGVRYLREYHALDEINPRTLGTLVPSPHKKTDRFGFHPPSGGWDPLVIWAKKKSGGSIWAGPNLQGFGSGQVLVSCFFFFSYGGVSALVLGMLT